MSLASTVSTTNGSAAYSEVDLDLTRSGMLSQLMLSANRTGARECADEFAETKLRLTSSYS